MPTPTRSRLTGALLALALPLAFIGANGPARAEPTKGPAEVCGMVIAAAEQALAIPRQLLAAIARAESGRWIADRRASFAWPWTVTAEGQGHYYETKADAIAAVRRFRARGATNIDVGCLQVNLLHHPQAFKSLEAALDPMENTIYAARLLKSLHGTGRSWTNAVALYHSTNPSARAPYVARVNRLWTDEAQRERRTRHLAQQRTLLAMAVPEDSAASE